MSYISTNWYCDFADYPLDYPLVELYQRGDFSVRLDSGSGVRSIAGSVHRLARYHVRHKANTVIGGETYRLYWELDERQWLPANPDPWSVLEEDMRNQLARAKKKIPLLMAELISRVNSIAAERYFLGKTEDRYKELRSTQDR